MAAYNAEKTIEQAIQSVLAQTYTKFELLVVNDCSTDNTENIVKRIAAMDSRVKLINNKKNSGVSYTRQRGLCEAKGDRIAILDSDDMWKPEKLTEQIYCMDKNEADLIYTGSAFMDAKGKMINWYLKVPDQISYRQLLKQNLISNSSVLVKKELYKQYYVTDDNMHEDFAVWLKILKSGKRAFGIDEPLLIYRVTKSSKSGNKLKAAVMNWNCYRYVGLDFFQSVYYMCWYTVKGVLKYKNLK